MKLLLSIFKGILAGASIALGGLLFTVSTFLLPNEGGKILGSLLFPIGLSLVCIFKFYLFTGKIGGVFEDKKSKDFYIDLPLMYIGNILGAVSIGYLCYAIFKDTDLFIRISEIANAKSSFIDYQSYLSFVVKSLITGLCVYLAVKSFTLIKKKYLGLIILFVFIALFVYIGGDHCVANMFYFSFGNNWNNFAFVNIALSTLCNALGTIPGVILIKYINK